ncbi:MAG: C69 family dipeptidase [Thermoproteales archaeon]|nr:C69 family dipeptidase [Thermoproteales archaeon]
MCDTLVALPEATREGATIFAKNSDREPNEAQVLEYYPRMRHDEEYVQCTYIRVPQVRETYAVIISRPFWMWGAEMGVNEWGLAIGNEAVFTREPYGRRGLTGMDMVRLALERCRTAREAVELIVKLLEEYGQGGNCGYTGRLYYHNSFLIADPREAWVLETAGSQVSVLYERVPINWFTATSTPCISLYKPVFVEAGLPDIGPEPRGEYDPRITWWRHEALHRRMLCSYGRYAPALKSRIRAVERELLREAEELRAKFLEGGVDACDLLALTERAFRESWSIEEEFLKVIKPGRCLSPLYALYWWRVNRAAKLPAGAP